MWKTIIFIDETGAWSDIVCREEQINNELLALIEAGCKIMGIENYLKTEAKNNEYVG